jgi:methylmalonyl-CoA epimerase
MPDNSTLTIGRGLAYLSVVVRDAPAVAEALERDFLLSRSDLHVGSSGRRAPVFAIGRTPVALFEIGDDFVGGAEKTGVHHIAVAVADPDRAAQEAVRKGLAVVSDRPEVGLGGANRLLLDPNSTSGVITYLSQPLENSGAGAGPVQRIDHVGVASRDNRVALDVFSHKLGWPVESTQTDAEVSTTIESFTSDKYGVFFHTRKPELVGGLRVAFITIGDCDLEFLQNLDQSEAGEIQRGQAGSTQQDRSVITRYIESRGPGLHHLALKVEDIDGLLSNLHQANHVLIDRVGRPGSRRAKIGFIHPASLGGLLVHLVQRED